MGKLSQTDQHEPYVQTGNNPQQNGPDEKNPKPGEYVPVKKEVQNQEQADQHKKTGTR
jgi:hypothetical protein